MKRKQLLSWLQQTKTDVLLSYSHMEAVQPGVHVYYSLGSLMK